MREYVHRCWEILDLSNGAVYLSQSTRNISYDRSVAHIQCVKISYLTSTSHSQFSGRPPLAASSPGESVHPLVKDDGSHSLACAAYCLINESVLYEKSLTS